MKKKIYWNMCLIALVAVVLTSLITTLVYYNKLEVQMRRETITEASYLEAGMEAEGEEYLSLLSGKVHIGRQTRITWIAQDGTVLFDNYTSNTTMENHGSRPEIKSALETGAGESIRTSDTLAEKTYYYASLLADGSVIRVANTTRSVWSSVFGMIPMMCLAAVAILFLSMLLADAQTKRIVHPINDLDLDHPQDNRVYDELAPLMRKVERQQETIQSQMNTLRTKQKEFAAITEHMNEGFIVVGKKAEVVSYNSSALNILGLDAQYAEESGSSILNFNRSHVFRKLVDEALEGQHGEQNIELNGRYYQLIANPVTEKGEVSGAIIVILDMTEKQDRENLRREFSANVSHELKTPLTSISGYAEIMKNGLVKPEDIKRFSENIYKEAQRMISLVGDIINLSQLDEGKVDMEQTTVDLHQMAENVVLQLKDHATAEKVTLELKGTSQMLQGTPRILDEMIYNLCDNAIKYNKTGGIVTVDVFEKEGHPAISVEDNGIGIPEADKERVFERFYRVDKSHSKQIGGTGLGLSIVKHGAIYHKARVEMESKEGRGTKVTIVF